jgi:hypothetical protein
MGIFKKAMISATAASLAIVPAVASATDASKLSVAPQARAGATTAKGEEAVGGGGIIVGILAAAAVIAGIVIIADGDDDSDSN